MEKTMERFRTKGIRISLLPGRHTPCMYPHRSDMKSGVRLTDADDEMKRGIRGSGWRRAWSRYWRLDHGTKTAKNRHTTGAQAARHAHTHNAENQAPSVSFLAVTGPKVLHPSRV